MPLKIIVCGAVQKMFEITRFLLILMFAWELSTSGHSAGIEMLWECHCSQITSLSLYIHLCWVFMCLPVVYFTGMPCCKQLSRYRSVFVLTRYAVLMLSRWRWFFFFFLVLKMGPSTSLSWPDYTTDDCELLLILHREGHGYPIKTMLITEHFEFFFLSSNLGIVFLVTL